mgnify:CR=1 FL=1
MRAITPWLGQGVWAVQIQSVATYLGPEQGFTFISDGLAVVEQGGYLRLLYAQRTDNRLGAITLETGVTPTAPAPGAPVIGMVTSGALSPTLGYPIAMASVDPAFAELGTELAIDVRGTALPATVVAMPFYTRPAAS